MERYLMDLCLNYGKDFCNDEVRSARRMSGPDEPGDPSERFPRGKKQARLDEICESCPSGFFEIEGQEAPTCSVCLCELWDLDKNVVKESRIDDEAGSILIYDFNCPRCTKHGYSKTNIWA